MLLGQGSSVLIQAAYFVFLSRLLGSSEYGIFVGASAAVSIVSQYSSLGAGIVLIEHVSQSSSLFSEYWGRAIATLSVCSVVILLGLLMTSRWVVGPQNAGTLMILGFGDVVFAQLINLSSQSFQAHERVRFTAATAMATSAARLLLAGGLFLRLRHISAHNWAFASLSVTACAAIVCVSLVTISFGRPLINFKNALRGAREGLVYAFSNSTASAYNDLDKAMLAHFGMTAANGVYSVAYKIVDIGTIPIRSIHYAAFPRFFQHGSAGLKSAMALALSLLRRTSVLGILVGLGMFVAAPVLPRLLGHSFQHSSAALRWLSLIPLFRAFHLSAGDALVGAGHKSKRLICQVGAVSLNVALNIHLIPRYSWRGAAWSSLVTDGSLGAATWLLVLALARMKQSLPRQMELNTAEPT